MHRIARLITRGSESMSLARALLRRSAMPTHTILTRTLLGLSVALGACTGVVDEPEANDDAIVFREADGSMGFNVTGALPADVYDWRSSIAMVVSRSATQSVDANSIRLRTIPSIDVIAGLASSAPLWADVALGDDSSVDGPAATGWLAGPDILVTSLHALLSAGRTVPDVDASLAAACANWVAIFTDGAAANASFPRANVHRCTRVIGRGGRIEQADGSESLQYRVRGDWVIIQLDRPAAGRQPLPIASSVPAGGVWEPIISAGHPLGVRLHATEPGVGLTLDNRIYHTLSTLPGSSGAPIIVIENGEARVIGIVAGGPGAPPYGSLLVEEQRGAERAANWFSTNADNARARVRRGQGVPRRRLNYATEADAASPLGRAILAELQRPTAAPEGMRPRGLGTQCVQRLSAYLGNARADAYAAPASEPNLTSEWVWLREGDRAHYQFGSMGDGAALRMSIHPRSRDRVRALAVNRLTELDEYLRASTVASGTLRRHWIAPVDGWYRAEGSDVTGAAGYRGRVDFVAREAYVDRQSSDCQPSTCFGAVGSDCDGITLPDVVKANVPGSGDVEPCRALASGALECGVAVGSQTHDSCCGTSPDGFFCGSAGLQTTGVCRDEFIGALAEVTRRESWRVEFDPTDFWYLTERTRLAELGTGRPTPGNTMRAPAGTILQRSAVESGWCGTIGSEYELPQLPNVPVIPTISDRMRCRNVLAWGDTTEYRLSGSTMVALAGASAGAPLPSLQAALLRSTPLPLPRRIEFGFTPATSFGLEVWGELLGFALIDDDNSSGWNVKAFEPSVTGALPGALVGAANPNPATPGSYPLPFTLETQPPIERYSDSGVSWRDATLSPLMTASVLDAIVTQNALYWRSSTRLELSIDIECRPPTNAQLEHGWAWQPDRQICECPRGQEWVTIDDVGSCRPECGCGESRDGSGGCVVDDGSTTRTEWRGAGIDGSAAAASAGAARRNQVECCPAGLIMRDRSCLDPVSGQTQPPNNGGGTGGGDGSGGGDGCGACPPVVSEADICTDNPWCCYFDYRQSTDRCGCAVAFWQSCY